MLSDTWPKWSGLPALNKTDSDWSSKEWQQLLHFASCCCWFLRFIPALEGYWILSVTRWQSGREAKHSGFEVSCDSWLELYPVTSSLWVVSQGANLTEPQFSHGMLRWLKEIRQLNNYLCSPGKPSKLLIILSASRIGWLLIGQSILSKDKLIMSYPIVLIVESVFLSRLPRGPKGTWHI